MQNTRQVSWALLLILWLTAATFAIGHPMPDVLVRSFFEEDGSAVIRVELDPRSFTEDPLNEPYLENWILGDMNAEERAELVEQAKDYIEKAVELRFLPEGKVEPEFAWRFTGHDDAPLEKIDDPVMLTGEWSTRIPPDLEGYQVHAHDYRELSVYFLNHVRDEAIERYQVMFPGETSYVLDLKELAVAGEPETDQPDVEPAALEDASSGSEESGENAPEGINPVVPLAAIAVILPILMLVMVLLKRKIDS